MDREVISRALNSLDDRYISEAAVYTPRAIQGPPERTKDMRNRYKATRIMLVAAITAAVLAVTAFAVSYFTMNGREAFEGEKYHLAWNDAETGFLEWTNLKYILKFDGAEECRGAEFKEGWLPFAPNEEINAWARTEDGWRSYLVSEGAEGVDSTSDNYQPYKVELYYAPQFMNDGALLMLNQTPGEITKEQWGDEQVMKFEATRHQDAFDDEELDIHIPEKDLHYYFVLRFHPGKGYILVISGTSDIETVERVAREVQIRETDEIIRSSDFTTNCTFIDVSQG